MKKRLSLFILISLIVALVLSLSSCELLEEILGSMDIEEEKQIPVYQGMTITKGRIASGTGYFDNDAALFAGNGNNGNGNGNDNGNNGNHNGHYKGDHEDKDEELNEENPYPDNDQNENIEEEIESSLKVIGSPDTVYYANPNQDIYINIHISNPDSFEIMSFTLNGKKYSSYMFEDGSDMETIILKYNVGNASGIVEYTIDAIKYIDGTEIKDVIIDGDTTVKAGIKVEGQVTATVKDLVVDTNDIAFNVNLRDNDKLIAHSNGTAKAVLYDGEEIVDIKDIKTGNNSVTFTNLKTNTVYQYAIVASYDDLSGKGVDMHILYVDAFCTESVVLFSDINVSQESISFGFAWHESREDKTLSALKLYKDGALVSDLAVDTTEITDLLSGNTYELIAEYVNGESTESIYLEFTTAEKTAPTIEIVNASSTQTSVSFEISETDLDEVGAITKIELVHGEDVIEAESLDLRAFADLLSGNTYKVRVTYVYNLNDGSDDVTVVYEAEIVTEGKAVPTVEIINTTSDQTSVSFEIVEADIDEVGAITKIEIVHGEDVIEAESLDVRTFANLLSNNTYKVRVTYVYDLNDGNGSVTETKEAEITTEAKATPSIEIDTTDSDQTSVSFDLLETDIDEIGAITKIELIHGEDVTEAESLDVRTFANLLSNNTYKVRVTYVYDLNDGNGVQTIIRECEIVTLSKTVPQVEISNVEITPSVISADCKFTDIDLVLSSYIAELYKGEELIAQNSDGSISFEFSENAKYTIRILYTYDLNDGKGIQTAVSSQDVYTGFAVTADNRAWIGYTGEANENLVIPATFEHDGAWYRVTSIGDNAFFECKSLVSVTIPNTVTSIGQQAFIYCEALTTVVIPEGVTMIDSLAFCFCGNLTNVTIPSTVENLGWGAFKGAQMTSVVIPDGITSIPANLFEWNESLQSITIPASVTSIDGGVFYYNKSLTTITFNGTVEQWANIAKADGWDELSGDYTITCTDGLVCKTHKYESVTINQTSTENGHVKYTCSGCGDSYIKTLPYVDVINCQIINTSAISEGETIYMQIALTNPDSVNVDSVVINGMTYNVISSSTATKLFVEIVYDGQFAGGDTYLSIDKLNATFDGVDYTVEPKATVADNVFINGKIEVLKIEFVNEAFEPIDWAFPSDTVYALITLDNPTGYTVDSVRIGTGSFYNSTPTKIDNNKWYFLSHAGWNTLPLTSLSYHNEYIEKTITCSGIDDFCYIVESETIKYISTPEDLKNMDDGYYYELTNDIDLSGIEWIAPPFSGIFDGKGYSIKNMSFVGDIENNSAHLGLFSIGSGIIQNLRIEEATFIVNMTSDNSSSYNAYYGGLVAYAIGKLYIDNCEIGEYTSVSINNQTGGYTYAGGLVGQAYASSTVTIQNSTNSGSVSATGDNSACAGGFIGESTNVTITNSTNNGDVSATSTGDTRACAGGLVGNTYDAIIAKSHNSGNVSAASGSFVCAGGLVGDTHNTIIYTSKNSGTVSSSGGRASAGGLIGLIWTDGSREAAIYSSMNSGYVNATGDCTCAGGLMAYAYEATICNSINIGSVNASDMGGLLAFVYYDQTITNSYSLVISDGLNGEACTNDQLNSKEFYTETLGWSEDIWDFSELDVENGKYPKLKK